jgi:HTH-type transcriptional regulator / antitoxin HigA
MHTSNEYNPPTLTHPGELLAERLEELGMTSKELAARTGKPEKTISAILNAQSAITPDVAVKLEQVLITKASYWLGYQAKYDELMAKQKRNDFLKQHLDWLKNLPIKAMQKFGWLPQAATKEENLDNSLQFLGFATPQLVDDYLVSNDKLAPHFRISTVALHNKYAIAVWLRKGELDAYAINCGAYNKAKFEMALDLCKKIVREQPDDYFEQLQTLCAAAGVRVVHTPNLPKAPINGAVRWLGNHPLIQLSKRYKRNDIFWFSFFHEAAHVLLHSKKVFFMEGTEYTTEQQILEDEANRYAAELLFTTADEQKFIKNTQNKPTEADIIAFAAKIGTHPAIIAGRLQRKDKRRNGLWQDLFVRLES